MKISIKCLNYNHILARINDNRGFTLVEVLIALLVLGILFVPVSNAFLQSVKMNQHLQQQVNAVRDAQAAMEVSLSVMHQLELAEDLHTQGQSAEEGIVNGTENGIEEGIEDRSKDNLKMTSGERVEALAEETSLGLAEMMTHQLSNFNSLGIIQPDTKVEIVPLHEDSPFIVLTATCPGNTNSNDKVPAGNFTLTTLGLPGEPPWLTPKEYRVMTP